MIRGVTSIGIALGLSAGTALADCNRYHVVATLAGHGCSDVTLSSSGERVYVRHGISGSNGAWRVYQGTPPFAFERECAVSGLPWTSDLSPDDSTLWTSVYFSGAVRKLDGSTCGTLGDTAVGAWPDHVLADAQGDFVYVGQNDPGTGAIGSVKVVNAVTGNIDCSVTLNGEPGRMAQASGDSFFYVTTRNAGTERLFQISKPPACAIVGTLDLFGAGGDFMGFSVTPDGSTLYLAARYLDAVLVIETSSLTVVDQFSVDSPCSASLAPSGDHLVVRSADSPQLSVIDVPCGEVRQTLALPIGTAASPGAIEFSPDGRFGFIPAGDAGAIVIERGCQGDLDNDGRVNLTDIAILLSNYGRVCWAP